MLHRCYQISIYFRSKTEGKLLGILFQCSRGAGAGTAEFLKIIKIHPEIKKVTLVLFIKLDFFFLSFIDPLFHLVCVFCSHLRL